MLKTFSVQKKVRSACEGSPITHHLVHSVATTPGQVPIINDFRIRCEKMTNLPSLSPKSVSGDCNHAMLDRPKTTFLISMQRNRAIQLGLKGVKIHPDTQKVNMDDPRLEEE